MAAVSCRPQKRGWILGRCRGSFERGGLGVYRSRACRRGCCGEPGRRVAREELASNGKPSGGGEAARRSRRAAAREARSPERRAVRLHALHRRDDLRKARARTRRRASGARRAAVFAADRAHGRQRRTVTAPSQELKRRRHVVHLHLGNEARDMTGGTEGCARADRSARAS